MHKSRFCLGLAASLFLCTVTHAAPKKSVAPTAAASSGEAVQAPALLAQAQGELAFQLIEHLAGPGTRTIAVSPASLGAALELLTQGADAGMRAAIVHALGFGTADITQSLAALSGARVQLAANPSGAFVSADRLVFAPSAPPSPAMQESLKAQGVAFSVEDLTQPAAAAGVDAWVNDTTQGAIPQILGGPLDHAGFVALNALHFKSSWQLPFDASRTSSMPFLGSDGKSQPVAMMQLPEGEHSFRSDKNFVGIDLPFADPRFSLVVVTSTDRSRAAKDFKASASWLTAAGFARQKGSLALPRFSLSARMDLLPVLDSLGLVKARNARTALQGFGTGTSLSQVLQRSMIEVDEAGAEAAAATAVVTTRALAPDNALHMMVDRPFIFALRDRLSGLVLIAGYVGVVPVAGTK